MAYRKAGGVKPTGSLQPIPGRCRPQLKYTGDGTKANPPRYCMLRPSRGRRTCRLHGGNSLSGVAHPQAQGLLYSTALPARIASTYAALLQEPEPTSPRGELAVTKAMPAEQIGARTNRGSAHTPGHTR